MTDKKMAENEGKNVQSSEEEQMNESTYNDETMKEEPSAGQEGRSESTDAADNKSTQADQNTEEDKVSQELDELRRQVEEHQQKVLRTQADFDNFRRRTRQEKEEKAKYASQNLIEQLLPVLDNFERALDSSKTSNDFEALAKGVDMIFRQIDQLMDQEGLKRMETVGQPFNPDFHQAIMQVESEEYEEGYIVEEVQKGYMLKDKVIRPAMVKVSN